MGAVGFLETPTARCLRLRPTLAQRPAFQSCDSGVRQDGGMSALPSRQRWTTGSVRRLHSDRGRRPSRGVRARSSEAARAFREPSRCARHAGARERLPRRHVRHRHPVANTTRPQLGQRCSGFAPPDIGVRRSRQRRPGREGQLSRAGARNRGGATLIAASVKRRSWCALARAEGESRGGRSVVRQRRRTGAMCLAPL